MRAASIRHWILFVTPLIVLGMTPRWPLLSGGIAAGSVVAALVLGGARPHFRHGAFYSLVAVAYLAVAVLRSGPISEYGLRKAVFVATVILPFAWAVSNLVRKPEEIRWILMGFLTMGVVIAIGSVGLADREFLGPERYQWQGNLGAFGIVILLQRWVVRRPIVVIPLVLLLGAAVAIAAAKQALGLLAVGLLVIILVEVGRGRRGLRTLMMIASVALVLAMSWKVVLPASITGVFTGRLQQIIKPEGGVTFLQRGLLFQKAWMCFQTNPLAGVGLGKYEDQPGWTDETAVDVHAYPHSITLEVLCEHGMVGFSLLLLPFFLLCVDFFFRSMRRAAAEPYLAALLIFLLSATTASLTGDLASRPIWIFGVLLIRLEFLPRIALSKRQNGSRHLEGSA
jgi:O-Antigen ligase